MRQVFSQIMVSAITAFVVLLWYNAEKSYLPSEQVNDALQCLLAWGGENSGQMPFDFTGLAGERLGWLGDDPKYLTLIGKDDTGATRAVYCKLTDQEIMVSPYTGATIKVRR